MAHENGKTSAFFVISQLLGRSHFPVGFTKYALEIYIDILVFIDGAEERWLWNF